MKRIFELAARLRDFLYSAIVHSACYRAFGSEGITHSVFYALLCVPYRIFSRVNAKHGAKIAPIKRSSRLLDLRVWLIAFAAAVPFITKFTFFLAIGLLAVYITEAVCEDGFAKKPSSLDALVYIFAALFAVFADGFSAGGFAALLTYSALTKSITHCGLWKITACVFIGASTLSAAVGRFGDGRIFSEFFILAVPFGFAAAREFEKPYRGLMYGFCALLALIFITRLSKGNITPAGIALGIFLCMRDLRFVLPALAALGTLFGRLGNFLALVTDYSFTAVTGTASLVMSAVLYLNLMNYSSKRAFLRTVTAALGSSSVLLLSGGGSSMGYMFFTILAITSAMM